MVTSSIGGNRVFAVLLAICAVVAALVLFEGPPLGEHECLVALIARDAIATGQWLIPHCLSHPFLVKPPLSPWAVHALQYIVPLHMPNGEPVTDVTARLPSLLSSILTCFIVYKLAASLFGRRTAWIAAFLMAASLGTWLYAFNATAEAMVTFFCAWAFAEFWWATRARSGGRRLWHMIRFYLALGGAMLAKAPMPLAVVALPLAAYWWMERPLRVLTAGVEDRFRRAIATFGRGAWPRFRDAFTKLGVWWGIPLFLATFVPWMIHVSRQYPYVWRLWDYEYVGRAGGSYPGSSRSPVYYVPILIGLSLPWALSIPESVIAPFLAKYRKRRSAIFFVWFWAFGGFVIMSAMLFKRPYYILPTLPGWILLLTPVIEQLFFTEKNRPRLLKAAMMGLCVILAVMAPILWRISHTKYPELWEARRAALGVLGGYGLMSLGLAGACWAYLRRRRLASLALVGLTGALTFATVWVLLGPSLSYLEDPLAIDARLTELGVSRDTPLYWVGNRPDPRVAFYADRAVQQAVDTDKLIAEHDGAWRDNSLKLEVASQLAEMLRRPEPIYMVFERRELGMFQSLFSAPITRLAEIDHGHAGKDKDDWILVTNQPAVGEGGHKPL